MIRHLRGSLSSNISEINKNSGCPNIKQPFRNYSVLRYFSRMKDDTQVGITGVVGDGGFNNDSSYNPDVDKVFYYDDNINYGGGQIKYKNINLNDSIPHVAGIGLGTFVGDNNYLNLCNRRELISGADDDYINDSSANCIQNIELANDIVEADGSDYFNYNLYKKSHTMDIIPAGSDTPVSKTAELMEFVFLHAFIPKCKSGELYIEIEDFDLTGATTQDYLIYCYYWETTLDKNSITEGLANVNDYLSGNDDLLLSDQGNTCCKVFKLSDVKGTGADKKLIIWLNRLKTKAESFAVNVLIGMNPQELRRDQTFYRTSNATHIYVTHDECDDIVFKFKRATIKIGNFSAIDNQPIAFPDFGYIDLKTNVHSDNTPWIKFPIHALDASGNALPINTQSGIVEFGVPNGGVFVSASYTWNGVFSVIDPAVITEEYAPTTNYVDEIINYFTMLMFHRIDATLDAAQNYILKLPCFTNPTAVKFSVSSRAQMSLPADWVIKIYAGEEIVSGVGGEYDHYQDCLDSMVLLATYNPGDISDGIQTFNSGSNSNVVGSPYYSNEICFIRKNKYKYISFAGSVLSGLSTPIMFYASIERSATDVRTISYGATGDGTPPPNTFYYPTGYGRPNTTNGLAIICPIAEYLRPRYDSGSTSELCKNYNAMIYKSPQIIDKTATPTAENYYA